MGFWSKLFNQDYVEVERQDELKNSVTTVHISLDDPAPSDEKMAEIYQDIESTNRTLAIQDNQLKRALQAETEYKETKDADKLVEFWEQAMKEGWTLQGASWPFKLTESYYRAKRYDDAWRALNKLVLNPEYRTKARKWQIKILKKEKKDYTYIQDLLDSNK